jgi:hypothetical protein
VQNIRDAWRSTLPDETRTALLGACLLNPEPAAMAWARFEKLGGDARAYFERDVGGLKGLLPFVAHALDENGVAANSDFMTYARVALVREELRSKIYYEVLQSLCECLARNGVDHYLLKGAAFASWLYPAPNVRHNHGIDLLVARADMASVSRLLVSAGFRPSPERSRQFDHETGLPIVLHNDLIRHPLYPDGGMVAEGATAPAPDRVLGELHSKTLLPTWHLHQILGNAAFANSNPNLRWVVDVVFLIRNTEIDWATFVAQARRVGLALFYAEVLRYARDNFSLDIPSAVLADLSEAERPRVEVLFASLLGTLGTHHAVWRVLRGDKHLRLRFIWYVLKPPVNYLKWRYEFDSTRQIIGWYTGRPWRVLARLVRARSQGAAVG